MKKLDRQRKKLLVWGLTLAMGVMAFGSYSAFAEGTATSGTATTSKARSVSTEGTTATGTTAAETQVYYVNHYIQMSKGSRKYGLAKSEHLIGNVGAAVTAKTAAFEGYTLNTSHVGTVAKGTIPSKGTLVLNQYYDAKDANVAAYKVQYYVQALKNYPYFPLYETEVYPGVVGKTVTAQGKSINMGSGTTCTEDKTNQSRVASGTVKGDGSLILKLYYNTTRTIADTPVSTTATAGSVSTTQSTDVATTAKIASPSESTTTADTEDVDAQDEEATDGDASEDTEDVDAQDEEATDGDASEDVDAQDEEATDGDASEESEEATDGDASEDTEDVDAQDEEATDGDASEESEEATDGDASEESEEAADEATSGEASDNTATYKVVYYKYSDFCGRYVEADIETLTGTVGEEVSATAKTYPGYTQNKDYKWTSESGTVDRNGTLVLRLFYDKDSEKGNVSAKVSDFKLTTADGKEASETQSIRRFEFFTTQITATVTAADGKLQQDDEAVITPFLSGHSFLKLSFDIGLCWGGSAGADVTDEAGTVVGSYVLNKNGNMIIRLNEKVKDQSSVKLNIKVVDPMCNIGYDSGTSEIKVGDVAKTIMFGGAADGGTLTDTTQATTATTEAAETTTTAADTETETATDGDASTEADTDTESVSEDDSSADDTESGDDTEEESTEEESDEDSTADTEAAE